MTHTDARQGAWIQTFTGRQFWPMDARPDEIDIRDIAHSLSMQCRFNGHCRAFYSVAEHSVHVSRVASPEHALWGLLHDSAETYLSDVPKPIKEALYIFNPDGEEGSRLSGVLVFEHKLLRVISRRFRLPDCLPPEVLLADLQMLSTEKGFLMGKEPAAWEPMPEPLDRSIIKCWTPGQAEREFLNRFNELSK
ncbi:MAG: phosphohydrolase [Magnetococcus sp. YQC-5]